MSRKIIYKNTETEVKWESVVDLSEANKQWKYMQIHLINWIN